jgi:hypothetical protein
MTVLLRDCEGNGMIFSNDRRPKDGLLNTLGDELAAAWVRFYAIEVDSRPGTRVRSGAGRRQEAGGRGRRDRRNRRRTA